MPQPRTVADLSARSEAVTTTQAGFRGAASRRSGDERLVELCA
jgi:hypothetical protein